MSDLTTKQRADRLAAYLRTISGGTTNESILAEFSQATNAVDGLDKRATLKANEAIRKSMQGTGQLSHDDLFRAEAIVHKTKRPSHLISDGSFDPFPDEFGYLTEDDAAMKSIKKAIPAVGRIDLPLSSMKYGGTGFVVGKNLVMTNRHVADLFTTGVGRTGLTIKPWQPGEVDFKKEFGTDSSGFPLKDCVMVHPYWDMALFTADLPDEIIPLKISTISAADLLNRDVVVIGYPAFDPERNDPQVQQEIFDGKYNVKRIAPGRIIVRKKPIGSSWLTVSVDALAHDSSTLGGNSGSAVLDVASGCIDGLHFAGRYLVENYAVPGIELARDPRVVDAGVLFEGELPLANTELDHYWTAVDNESLSPSIPQPRKKPTMTKQTPVVPSRIATGRQIEIEVPLRITVSLGETSSHSTLGRLSHDNSSDDAEIESVATGFNTVFLSETVPTPELSADHASDAFTLNGTHLLDYTHFSVCQSKSRKLPRFVSWNIDGAAMKSVSRNGIPFILDSRVPAQFQAGDELYKNNRYDRGHVARRADLTWGSLAEAKRANKDSFFFTNITPQHESFNQSSKRGLWGELENAILEDVDVENLRVSVMAGPIFKDNDPKHRNVKIPRDFWKLIAFRDTEDNEFKVAAFILTQSELIPTEVLELDPFKLYQVSLTKLANETDLGFDELVPFDSMDTTRESLEGSGVREIKLRSDVI
ncbi:MAG: DNA/RNA non-specific endonuclease [Pirellulaceae bacterium]|nr:DNA/RNA non-specific endonuclease [Pirellulaceae bacterium]